MAAPARIIVVDDEEGVRDTLADYLDQQGYAVRCAEGGAALDRLLAAEPADLVMLDLNMPGEDGFAIARRVRSALNLPVIMVTAADTVIDRVAGLESGADDYVNKPFDLREVRSRVRAVLRRYADAPPIRLPETSAEATPIGRILDLGHASIDLEGHRIVRPEGDQHNLTIAELGLIRIFAENPYIVLSRERLWELAGEPGPASESRSIDIRIARLRKKIELDPANPEILRTVRGQGYLFAPPKRTP